MARPTLTKMKCETCDRKLQVGEKCVKAQCNICLMEQSAVKAQERAAEEDKE